MYISDIEEGLLALMINQTTYVDVDENAGWRKPLDSGFFAEDWHVCKSYSRQTDCYHNSVELFGFMIT